MKYFKDVTTLEELKKQYHKLAAMHHPDVPGGSTEAMQEINAEYDILFKRVKDVHRNAKGQTYTKETQETPNAFKDLISLLMKLEGIDIEIIGCFVWVSGETRQHRNILKDLGFKWHSQKLMWYLSPEGYRRRGSKDYDMDEIRAMYGVQYRGHGSKKEENKTERLPA